MAIRFNNGKEIQFFASSGALGFDGRGWWWNRLRFPEGIYPPRGVCPVSKTITLDERPGNGRCPLLKVRPVFSNDGLIVGWVNALGLPNKGFYWFREKILPKIDFKAKDFIVSIAGTKEELCYMAMNLDEFEVTAIEINLSCPNTEDMQENTKEAVKILREVARHTRHDLIAKISYAQDFVGISRGAEGLARAVSFNSVPWRVVFPNKRSPFACYGEGGVSGRIVRWFYEDMAVKIRRFSKTPVIMPVWDEGDLKVNDEIGADAHSFGSVFIASPTWPAGAVKKYLSFKNNVKMVP